jgi:anti-sigma factor RsiW
MNGHDEKELRRLLKAAMLPFAETAPHRDLWPLLRGRLAAPALRVPWWDWTLLAAAIAMFFLCPGIIPALLYHF